MARRTKKGEVMPTRFKTFATGTICVQCFVEHRERRDYRFCSPHPQMWLKRHHWNRTPLRLKVELIHESRVRQ